MSPIESVLAPLAEEIGVLTAMVDRRVDVRALRITDRAGDLPLAAPGRRSPNGSCRLIEAADGWIAINLARQEDLELLPAWLEQDAVSIDGGDLDRLVRRKPRDQLVAGATLLGLPVAAVGEVVWDSLLAPTARMAAGSRNEGPIKVVDLSALWAGPLCGAILAAMGAQVAKIESPRRPDPTWASTPDFHRRLNGGKASLQLDFSEPQDLQRLQAHVLGADVLITSARPRAWESLGLSPGPIFAANPGMVWVAVTGYGCSGQDALRVAFGDDAAAAGGLVRRGADRAPSFVGDALADPITGLVAAVGALKGLIAGGGLVVDAALARCAAGAAAALDLERAA